MGRDTIVLRVGGLQISEWSGVTVTRQLDAISGTFEFKAFTTNKSKIHDSIFPGLECTVVLGDKEVIDQHELINQHGENDEIITGFIDDVDVSYDNDGMNMTVRGRDRTGQLVDNSAEHKNYRNIHITQLAEILCKPFGIDVFINAPVGEAFREFSVEPGMTAFEAIETAARMRALLPTSGGNGSLLFTRVGGERIGAVLKRGVNIIKAQRQSSQKDRFSHYTVLGQDSGDDNKLGAALSPKGVANDPGINPRRKLTILAENKGDAKSFKERAVWESVVRYGRSNQIQITTLGWRHNKAVWKPNQIVKIQDDWLGVDGEFVISEVVLRKDEQGTLSDITLMPPEAFNLIPLDETSNVPTWVEQLAQIKLSK